MERKLEGWRAGGMDVWQLAEVCRSALLCRQKNLMSGWQSRPTYIYAAKNKKGKKVGSSEDKLFNESGFSENLKEQQPDKNPSTFQPFNRSTDISLPSYPLTFQPSIIAIIMALFLTLPPAFAEDLPMSALVTPTNVDFKICTRNYIMPEEKLFYMAIASAGANNFEVNEIQSKTGYILFTAAGKQYLASISKVDSKNSMIKITPVNNNYFFAPGIVLNFFKYIDLNGATPIVNL